MIETKLFEVRDRGTFIPVAAFRCRSQDVYVQCARKDDAV